MNSFDRKRVDDYFSRNDSSTLHLDEDPLDRIAINLPLDALIYDILELTNQYKTLNKDGSYQCRAGAYRSSGDIWRLVKYVKPYITIFDVLQTLYDMAMDRCEDDMYCSFCDDIGKRVFSSEECDLSSEDRLDEYGLELEDWNGI